MNDINTNFNFGEFNKNIVSNNGNTKVDNSIKTNISTETNSYVSHKNNTQVETLDLELSTNNTNETINIDEEKQSSINNDHVIELSPYEIITENGPVEFGNKDKIISSITGAYYGNLDITNKKKYDRALLKKLNETVGTIGTNSISIINSSINSNVILNDIKTLIGKGINYSTNGKNKIDSLSNYMWNTAQIYFEGTNEEMKFFY